MTNSKGFRIRARSVMKERIRALILTALVFVLVSTLISVLSSELTGVSAWNREFSRRLEAAMDPRDLASMDPVELAERVSLPDIREFYRGPFALILAFLLNMMSVPLSAGYTYHTLCESRREPTRVSSIFFGFRMVWKTIALNLLTGLLVWLGMLCFLVPGIILLYRYSLAIYVLLDDPSKGIVQCMKESGWRMRGQKWRLFKLELSFIWWLLLSGIVTSLIGLPVLDLWLMPYMYLARALFYNEILGTFRLDSDDDYLL